MEGFLLNLATLEEFYKRCAEKKAITREEREAVLKEMAKELLTLKLNDKDIKNQMRGKKVLHIKRQRSHNEN